jgi:hypothetical protein
MVRFALVGKVPEREFFAHAMLPINHQVRVAGGRMASGARAKQEAQLGGVFARVMATVRRVRKQRQRAAKQRRVWAQAQARAALQAGWLQQQNAAAAAPRAGGGLGAAQKGSGGQGRRVKARKICPSPITITRQEMIRR